MEITLTVTDGPHVGRVFRFVEHDKFLVGRSKLAHFRLSTKDRYISRMHFMVEVNPPDCRLLDMGSRNGTYVNGKRVPEADLKDGDEIRAGKTLVRVTITLPPSTALPEVPEAAVSIKPPTASRTLYATIGPDRAREATPVPAPPRPAVQPTHSATVACLVCANPVASSAVAAPPRWPLCPACQREGGKLEQTIAGYQLLRVLGMGGMGLVYLALAEADGSLVALKTLIPAAAATQSEIQRFLREAQILRKLSHPHIVAFRDMRACPGLMYFVMDYIRGTDARHLLKEHGPFEVGRAVSLICQCLEALEYAHAQGYVHRDLKPANLLVTHEGGREVTKLADLGLARDYQISKLSGLTIKGEVGGTAAFMPPEQVTDFRTVKPPSDQYSAAATLYTLLTDAHVYNFPGPYHEQLMMILFENPVPIEQRRSDLPRGLAEVIHRALAREPEQRFADVKAMREALLKYSR